MPFFLRFQALSAAAAFLGVAVMFSTGCSESDENTSATDDTVTTSYQVRGQIVSLPAADNPGSSLSIHHEAIPEFVDGQGKIVGMDSMAMPFPPADGLDLGDFAVGDKVQVTFAVTWGGEHNGWEATALTKLPDDTELDFSSPAVPAVDHGEHDHDHTDHSGHAH